MGLKMWGRAKSCRTLQVVLRNLFRDDELRSLSRHYKVLFFRNRI